MFKLQRVAHLAAFLVFALTSHALLAVEPPGDAVPPTQSELIKLLAGNSNQGIWEGRSYQQYFSPDGATRYQEENSRPSAGSWRVNGSGQYCSIWPPSSREVCYKLLVSGDDIYWQSGDKYFHAKVIPGNIFSQ